MSHDGTVSTNFETFVKGCIVKSFVGETIYYIKHTEIMMLTTIMIVTITITIMIHYHNSDSNRLILIVTITPIIVIQS